MTRPMQDNKPNQMDSKGIVYRQPSRGYKFPMIVTVFDAEGTEMGKRSGARGRYVLFTFIDGMIQDQFYDPYEMDLAAGDDDLRDFCLRIRRGWTTEGNEGIPWDRLEDDSVYTPDSFRSFY